MILVTGAAGNVGDGVVGGLLDSGEKIRVLTRNPDGARRWASEVEVVAGDLTDVDSLAAALSGVTKVFLLLVLPGIPQADPIVQAVRRAGVEHVVLMSSIRAGSQQDSAIKHVNLAAEAAVRNSGMGWTFLRGGTFMSNTLQWAPSVRSERIVRAHGGGFRSSAVDPRDVGAVAARVLIDSDAHRSRSYVLTGSEIVTITEQVAVLGDLLGERVEFQELPEAVVRTMMTESLHLPSMIVDAMISMYQNSDESLVVIDPAVRDILGRAPRSFRQWTADNIESFR